MIEVTASSSARLHMCVKQKLPRWPRFEAIPSQLKAGENLKRKEIKELMQRWDREFPGRIYNIFMSLTRVSPSHLLDRSIYDFTNFAPIYGTPGSEASGESEDE